MHQFLKCNERGSITYVIFQISDISGLVESVNILYYRGFGESFGLYHDYENIHLARDRISIGLMINKNILNGL